MAKKKRKLTTRFDGCCHACGRQLGYKFLLSLFEGYVIDPNAKDPKKRIECPECETDLRISLIFDFAVHEVPFD